MFRYISNQNLNTLTDFINLILYISKQITVWYLFLPARATPNAVRLVIKQ